ncbi:MAG: Large extracellular alpha-helical protein [Candidatus Daviesbacteria bacterium GW2011_GWC2_40_12]|uniref:Large extracellular alpha-helical protein n=1 Tax=Candidatus Daviesbacteria bacterium GW2011_GWC2_40_12 TaxID=1618431 RepID=A0A0G0QZH9_9BACT|nr:MAG: Large extracellular alpha-helical protein [Candidatus Daviesbacteria bacterium GW2011_GWC2_40_12]
MDIDLKFDSGNVGDERKQNVQIKSNSMQEFFWKVKPDTENPAAKLTFGARSKADKNLADIVTLQIPVKNFGFERKLSYAAEGPKTFDVKLAPDSHREKSQITLSLSPAITGSLPSAMKYLINYPYGCTEQTTSTIVPAIIAKLNPDLYGDALKDKNTDDILQKGVKRLESQQQSDGGWTWWGRDNSNPFVSAYVLEYLLLAQKSGTKVNAYILNQAKSYLLLDKYYDSSQEKKFSNEEIISKNYGLALLGQTSTNKLLPVFPGLTPDLLSLLVMSNYLNGDTNPQTNGLNALILMAREQGNALFWEAGTKINFGSRDASTALAIRAILLTNGDRELAAKGARFLTRNRQSDYWSNTFATAQVLRALTEFAKSTEEQTPAYSYAVTIDGKQIAGGTVSDPKQSIKDINIPAENIKSSGSKIAVTKNGSGQIYSTLTVNELRTDKNSKAENNGLTVKREYVNEKNPQFGLGVGDTALVKITVGGLKTEENYAVIQDELPSGMIPINESFENEQYGNMSFNSNQVTEREITENGIILSLYQIPAGEKTYTYRARVVSEGTFLTPPGVASLMYAPEISGSSNVQKINIAKKAERAPEVGIIGQKQILAAAVILIVLTVVIFMVIIRVIRKKQTPPQTPNDN